MSLRKSTKVAVRAPDGREMSVLCDLPPSPRKKHGKESGKTRSASEAATVVAATPVVTTALPEVKVPNMKGHALALGTGDTSSVSVSAGSSCADKRLVHAYASTSGTPDTVLLAVSGGVGDGVTTSVAGKPAMVGPSGSAVVGVGLPQTFAAPSGLPDVRGFSNVGLSGSDSSTSGFVRLHDGSWVSASSLPAGSFVPSDSFVIAGTSGLAGVSGSVYSPYNSHFPQAVSAPGVSTCTSMSQRSSPCPSDEEASESSSLDTSWSAILALAERFVPEAVVSSPEQALSSSTNFRKRRSTQRSSSSLKLTESDEVANDVVEAFNLLKVGGAEAAQVGPLAPASQRFLKNLLSARDVRGLAPHPLKLSRLPSTALPLDLAESVKAVPDGKNEKRALTDANLVTLETLVLKELEALSVLDSLHTLLDNMVVTQDSKPEFREETAPGEVVSVLTKISDVTSILSKALGRSYANIILARRDLALRSFPKELPDLGSSLRTASFSRFGLFGHLQEEVSRRVESLGHVKILSACADVLKRADKGGRSSTYRGRGSSRGHSSRAWSGQVSKPAGSGRSYASRSRGRGASRPPSRPRTGNPQ
jgi:hypothetical protein